MNGDTLSCMNMHNPDELSAKSLQFRTLTTDSSVGWT